MRVLLINHFASIQGGAELQILSLRDSLRALGHQADFFGSRSRSSPSFPIVADHTCFAAGGRLATLSMAHNPFAVSALRQLLASLKPDLIHLVMFRNRLSPAILPVLFNYPTIAHVQTYEPICPISSKLLPDGSPCHQRSGPACYSQGCFSLASRPFLLHADKATRAFWPRFIRRIAISQWQRQRLETDGIQIDAVIPNGVPEDPTPTSSQTPSPLLVCASRLVREKSIDHLLHAIASVLPKFPNLQLRIAGDGTSAKELRSLAASLNLTSHIYWLGLLPRRDLSKAFAGAWLQIVPGTWEEPFGLATAEAMMRGLPVIAPRRGASAELLNQEAFGFLYNNGNAQSLASTIERALSNPSILPAIGAAARAHARLHYLDSLHASRFVDLYNQILQPQ
ncbi:MAG: glycosyltransferase family 4 protein [Acidobacteria bacterium]|nr:glycosyltransferase family 4 protein [Acidobacteriota bacterium]